jgi:hypothetical protein
MPVRTGRTRFIFAGAPTRRARYSVKDRKRFAFEKIAARAPPADIHFIKKIIV